MSVRIDEFDVPTHLSLQDVKARIDRWLKADKPGSDYILMEVSDQHMKIRKEKHDFKICCITCCASCGIAFMLILVAVMAMMASYPYYSYSTVLAMASLAVLGGGVCMAAGIGYFCLRPQTATYVLKFSEGMPLRVTVYGEGQVEASRVDYDSLKSAILSDALPPAPAPW